MEDKLTNVLIAIILVIIIGLAGMYAYKVTGNTSYMQDTATNQIQDTISDEYIENNTEVNEGNVNSIVVDEVVENNQSQTVIIPSSENNTQATISGQSTEAASTYEYNNRYYYSQLDNHSKIIYDAIANNIENLKSGRYVISINGDFTPVLSQSDGQSKLKDYYDDAINAINLDIPNLFYIDFSKMYLNIETTSTIFNTEYRLYIDAGGNSTYFSSGFTSQSQIESAINSIETIKNSICKQASGDDYNKVRRTHDWLIEEISYDSSSYNKGNIYGVFIEKKVVCEGYARAYKYLLDNLGITNILVTGTATNSNGTTEEHMWNYVKINGEWYAVDPTWDDPIVYGGGTVSSGTKHRYFLIGSKDLYETHVEGKTISSSGKIFVLPTLSRENY